MASNGTVKVVGNSVVITLPIDVKNGGKPSGTGKTVNFGYLKEVFPMGGTDFTATVQVYIPLTAPKAKASDAPRMSVAEALKLKAAATKG